MLGLGEGQLELLGQGPVKWFAADRHVPLPDPGPVGDIKSVLSAPIVEQDDRLLGAAPLQLVEKSRSVQAIGLICTISTSIPATANGRMLG